MIGFDRVSLVLLAAGLSRRFGADDKLAVPFLGRPLADHAAAMFAGLPFARRYIVTGAASPVAGAAFTRLVNPEPEAGQAGSIRLGVAAAQADGAEAVLIALADMPFVGRAHVRRLLDRHDGPEAIVASGGAEGIGPPVLFAAAHFGALLALSGDRGARALLDGAVIVPAGEGQLADIDTPADLLRFDRHPGAR